MWATMKSMAFTNTKRSVLIAVGGGLAVALAVAGVTAVAALAIAPHLVSASVTPTPSAGSSLSPSPSPGHKANPAQQAIRKATVQAEAQVLGIARKDFTTNLKQGITVHQMADQKGISQATFQASFTAALTPLLDQDVQSGTITRAQEQRALQRFGAQIPNWDQAPHHK